MKTSPDGLTLIKTFEGFSAVPYRDKAGFLTIGFGHKILPGEVFGALSSVEATSLLAKDVSGAEDAINTLVKVLLTQFQFDALVSFVFNVGKGNFLASTLLAELNQHNYADVPNQLLRFDHVTIGGKKVVSQGLLRRRTLEGQLFLKGSLEGLDLHIDLSDLDQIATDER